MRDFVKILLKNGIGILGDKMNEHISPMLLYQPKAYKRGKILKQQQNNGKKIKKDI